MKIINLNENSSVYTSHVHYIPGVLEFDMSTLIDAGMDPGIIIKINDINDGTVKSGIDQIVLTHTHTDHAGIIYELKSYFDADVLAFSPDAPWVDRVLKNGDFIKIGEKMFEVIQAFEHTEDSILLFNHESGILFTGDVQYSVKSPIGIYHNRFFENLKKLNRENISAIFSGHGDPVLENCNSLIETSLRYVELANIFYSGTGNHNEVSWEENFSISTSGSRQNKQIKRSNIKGEK